MINKEMNNDKERLEQKELERQNQAQKDRSSFAFSWIAILIRGIVGTCISTFVYLQANRIEDENTMRQFLLINEIHQKAIRYDLDTIFNTFQESGTLLALSSDITDEEFNTYLVSLFSNNKAISHIQWHRDDDPSKKQITAVSIPSTPTDATHDVPITFHIPITDTKEKTMGYVAATVDLKAIILQTIEPKYFLVSDLYVYHLNTANEGSLLFYFFPLKKNEKLTLPHHFKDLSLTQFSEVVYTSFGDQLLAFVYIATPDFTMHTWQATIAAAIGMFITSFIVITAWILLEIEKRQFSNVLYEGHIQEIEGTIDLLEITKNRLVAQENLASLGGLTAGIAHEIKNPLNFINNFSLLSVDIVDHINQFITRHRSLGTPEEREEIYEAITTLKQNVEIIHEQGKRADNTIQRMLAHSRGKSGEWSLTDIHKILDEYINFSFHGMRAKNSNFNVKIEKKFESTVKEIEVVTNDMSRVFLNLLNNAFQAVEEKERKMGGEYQNPTVTIKTEDIGNFLRIRIRDNGVGISEEDKGKIFTPFFTTKPTGLGTGLGLSLSYNIIVREHGGSLTFESQKNEYTEFIITIPFERKKEQEVSKV